MPVQVVGAIVMVTMAAYSWYKFEQMSDLPSPLIRQLKSLRISKRNFAAGLGTMLGLYQIFTQAVGIPQNFWIGVASCIGIGWAFTYLMFGITGLGTSGKALLSLAGCFFLLLYTFAPLKSEWKREHAPPRTSVPLTALYIGCESIGMPITIRSGTAIHIMWIDPTILRSSPDFPFVGPFQDIAAPPTAKDLIWPTSKDGRWMTLDETKGLIKAAHTMATPFAFKCALTNYSPIILDEVTATFFVQTSDEKQHSFTVHFDPSVFGHPYDFYMVSRCSFGVVPLLVSWGNIAEARLLGEAATKKIPLKFERKAFPSNLAIPLASSFIWNDRKNGCDWGK